MLDKGDLKQANKLGYVVAQLDLNSLGMLIGILTAKNNHESLKWLLSRLYQKDLQSLGVFTLSLYELKQKTSFLIQAFKLKALDCFSLLVQYNALPFGSEELAFFHKKLGEEREQYLPYMRALQKGFGTKSAKKLEVNNKMEHAWRLFFVRSRIDIEICCMGHFGNMGNLRNFFGGFGVYFGG